MVRALLFFLLLPAAFAQPGLLISNAALPISNQAASLAPRSLVQVRLDPSFDGPLSGDPNAPQPVLDFDQPLTLTIQPEGSEELAVEILTASLFQVVAVLPADLPLGPAAMTLTYNGGLTSSGAVEIVPANFALFTDNYGTGPALAQNVNADSPIEINGLTRPARPGNYVTLWGTGLGHTAQEEVAVLLDGRAVTVQFAGPSPSLDGLDQINIFVPVDAGIADGCYVPLQVGVLGESGLTASISKTAAAGPCVHPLGLSEQQMQSLDEGGFVPIGRIGMYSVIGPRNTIGPEPVASTVIRFEHAEANFFATDAGGVAVWSRPAGVSAPGCRLNRSALFARVGFISSTGSVNVGEKVEASGPDGRRIELPAARSGSGVYNSMTDPSVAVEDPADLPPPSLAAGEWVFSAAGSSEAAPFSVTLRMPPAVAITNYPQLATIERAAGVTVTWAPEGYHESDTMLVQIVGRPNDPGESESESPAPALTLDCRVPALAGSLALEPELLLEFAASEPGLFLHLSLNVIAPPDEESRFTVELTSGETFPGLANSGVSASFPIELQ